ncbi:AAA family ATPase [Piscinibacter sp. XHJ-5]|uniref:ATP-binding protein n=1 Tax=Piscinibacter sp. XHJ-5 TaxID=3037797 RepID=UPI002453354E|nr:AAA family ATPase [Piscinibacter sp. XHJ-5]
MNVADWLTGLGLACYVEAFEQNDIDASTLRLLTEADLAEIGVRSVGHRRRLVEAIAQLHDEATSRAEPATKLAELRQISVVYCQLVARSAVDGEELRALVQRFHKTCTQVVTEYDGHVANFYGDCMLVYVGWPRAHEDDAERAVRAGLTLIRRVRASEKSIDARVGIATGPVVVGDLIREGPAQQQSAVGVTPNLAARVLNLAVDGQVLIDDLTCRLAGPGIACESLGSHTLKGIAGPVTVHAVLGEQAADSRYEARRGSDVTPMVGRDQELALLLGRWALARSGEGQAVLLAGEAGIGKSRLVKALLDATATQGQVQVRWQCSPYHSSSALWPVIQRLGRMASLNTDDSTDAALDKLEALFGNREAPAIYATLLGLNGAQRYGPLTMSPEMLRGRTLELLAEGLFEMAEQRPLLLLVEDAHWMDPTTRELIERCLEGIDHARMLLLMTSRPENKPALATHPGVALLWLHRLNRASVEDIVTRLAGDTLQPQTLSTIVAKTEGVPLFVEELTKAVLETGEASIPSSLHGSLMARLDRFPEAKEVAQIAACLGREFDHQLLAAVTQWPDRELDGAMDQLAAAEVVFQRGARPDARYVFKHALMQEVTYSSVPRGRRRQLHSRILDVLSAQHPTGAPEVRAQHAVKAQRGAEAVGYWEQAANASLAKGAYEEAARYFSHAIDIVRQASMDDASRDRQLRLLCQLGEAQRAAGGHGAAAALEAFEEAHRLLRDDHDIALRVKVVQGVWNCLLARGESSSALALGERLLETASRQPDRTVEFIALRILGTTQVSMGHLRDGRDHLRRVTALDEQDLQHSLAEKVGVEPAVFARGYLARAELLLGDRLQAERVMRRGLELSHGCDSLHTRAFARHLSVLLSVLARDAARAERDARDLLELTRQYRLRTWEAHARADLACALVDLGRSAEAIEEFERGFSQLDVAGAAIVTSYFHSAHARALAACGRVGEGLDVIGRTLEERGELRWTEAELWRVRGELSLLDPNESIQAAHCFHQALAVARSQHARAWELRTALSLGRWWCAQGRIDDARALLEPICEALAPCYDAPDLHDATALLRGLATPQSRAMDAEQGVAGPGR